MGPLIIKAFVGRHGPHRGRDTDGFDGFTFVENAKDRKKKQKADLSDFIGTDL